MYGPLFYTLRAKMRLTKEKNQSSGPVIDMAGAEGQRLQVFTLHLKTRMTVTTQDSRLCQGEDRKW